MRAIDAEFVALAQQFKERGLNDEEENFQYILTGSMVDGSNVCKWVKPDHSEMECDCQAVIGRISRDNYEHVIEAIPKKPDNVRLKLDLTRLDDVWPKFAEVAAEILASGSAKHGGVTYIESVKWRDFAKATTGGYPFEYPVEVGNLASNMYHSIDEPDVGEIKYSADFVFAFHSDRWPLASDFFERNASSKRQAWDPAVLKDIAQAGVDIVPKASPGGDPVTEWRWSFACVETKLFRSLSSQQMIV